MIKNGWSRTSIAVKLLTTKEQPKILELGTILIMTVWLVLVICSYKPVSTSISVLGTREFGGNCLSFGGNHFFLTRGAGSIKKGSKAPLMMKKGSPCQIVSPKNTDHVFLGIGMVSTAKIMTYTERKLQFGTQLYKISNFRGLGQRTGLNISTYITDTSSPKIFQCLS